MYYKKNSKKILDFWFGDLDENGMPGKEKQKIWWIKDRENDNFIKYEFEKLFKSAKNGGLEEWKSYPGGIISLIILTDQFPRNMYRDTPLAFSGDNIAVEASLYGINNGMDKQLPAVYRQFFYMPLMHSEDIEIQRKSLKYFSELEKKFENMPVIGEMLNGNRIYAEKHYEIIERFGRYPHRNLILGRESTDEEAEFLKQPGSSF